MPNKKDEIYKYQPLWGKWYIDLPIGKGSFGSVYKISREDMGKKYTSAVKMITIPSAEQQKEAEASLGNDETTLSLYFEDIVKNIINEVDMLYALSGNTNILNYQDHEVVKKDKEVGWDILIRMEYVKSLRDYLKEHVMTKEEVIKLGVDICSALETCSKKGIVHRDIKDENIFVNEDGIFKLGDFGIARELSKSGRAASMRGTPLYMAPEIFRGDKYDLAVDIYSLGIVMYKLLNNNRMPFMPPYPERVRYSDSEEALEKRMSGENLPIPANADTELGEIVLKACAHNSYDRYTSPTDMKKELLKLLVTIDAQELNTELGYMNNGIGPSTQDEQSSGTIGLFDDIYKPEQVEEEKEKSKSIKSEDNELDKTVGIFQETESRIEDNFSKNKEDWATTENIQESIDYKNNNSSSEEALEENKEKRQDFKGFLIFTAIITVIVLAFVSGEILKYVIYIAMVIAIVRYVLTKRKHSDMVDVSEDIQKTESVSDGIKDSDNSFYKENVENNDNKRQDLKGLLLFIAILTIVVSIFTFGNKSCNNNVGGISTDVEDALNLDDIIIFEDVNFEFAIREIIGKPSGDIVVSDVCYIESLEMNNKNITSIEDLKYFNSLSNLYLANNNIVDISILARLYDLEDIILYNNDIGDISALSGLTNLRNIVLSGNQIDNKELKALSGLENLYLLELACNNISDISALSELTNLVYLQLTYNQISDIDTISELTGLTFLSLNDNLIGDVAAVENLTKLEYLDISSNKVYDVAPLANLTELQYLYLSDNNITDYSPVKNIYNQLQDKDFELN